MPFAVPWRRKKMSADDFGALNAHKLKQHLQQQHCHGCSATNQHVVRYGKVPLCKDCADKWAKPKWERGKKPGTQMDLFKEGARYG